MDEYLYMDPGLDDVFENPIGLNASGRRNWISSCHGDFLDFETHKPHIIEWLSARSSVKSKNKDPKPSR